MGITPKPLNPNFVSEVLAKRAAKVRCEIHPDFLAATCAECVPSPVAAKDPSSIEGEGWKSRVEGEWASRVSLEHRPAKVDHPIAAEWAGKVRENHAEARSLFLLGTTGVGKTYQAYGALKSILWKPERVKWAAMCEADLLGSMRPSGTIDTETELDKYRKLDVLLIDDFGSSKTSEWVEEVIYRLVNYRFEWRKPTIFTSNLTPAEVKDAVGDRVASRLTAMCTRVALQGPDRRRVVGQHG